MTEPIRREADLADTVASVKQVEDQAIAVVLRVLASERVLRIDRPNRAIRIIAPGSIDLDAFHRRVDQELGRG